jgi:hypothetical protein
MSTVAAQGRHSITITALALTNYTHPINVGGPQSGRGPQVGDPFFHRNLAQIHSESSPRNSGSLAKTPGINPPLPEIALSDLMMVWSPGMHGN